MKMNNTAVVCCIERGGLEYKGLGMLLSLRKNWGRWSDVAVYVYSPRLDNRVSDWMRGVCRELGITLIDEPLNAAYADYPLANKPLCMAHAEKHVREEFVVFLDSDILCWNEPKDFSLPGSVDLAMVADGTKTVASSGPNDELHEPMWQRLYEIADVRHEPYNTTLLTDRRVRGWWSSGVIVSRRSAGLMERWMAVFEEAYRTVPFIPAAYYLREQMTVCAVAAASADRFLELPVSYNYPVQNFGHYARRGTSPEEAVLWHYQPYMNKVFRKLGVKLEKASSVSEKISIMKLFIHEVQSGYSKVLGLDESLLRIWRRNLALGPRLRKRMGCPKGTDPAV